MRLLNVKRCFLIAASAALIPAPQTWAADASPSASPSASPAAVQSPKPAASQPAKPAPSQAAKPSPSKAPPKPAAAATPVLPEIIAGYQVEALPANIAETPVTMPQENVKVYGEPRMSKGHPCTLWDQEDIDQIKERLKTNKQMQDAFAALKANVDARIAKNLNVPVPRKGPDDQWVYPGDFPEEEAPFKKVGRTNEANCNDMVNLGVMYVLSGDEKYGDYCKKMLLAYAYGYPRYGHPAGWTQKSYRSANDGRLTGQFLEDGFWLVEAAFAYDLVYNLPSWTPDERKQIHDDLLKAVGSEFYDPILGTPDYLSQTHNRSCLCASGVLIAGYATDDMEMATAAAYGTGGTKENPTGGLVGTHFGPKCLLPDGLWIEGAPGYQLGIASCGLMNAAETLWHHGVDLYRFRGGALKRLLDSAIALAYPDPKMTVAALHDSGRMAILSDAAWWSNEAAAPYEYGYRRYRDPRYAPIIRNAAQTFSMTVHAGPPSLFPDIPPAEDDPPRPLENANFYSVGYGVLRVASGTSANQLIMEYGPSAGHAHPSKLAIDLFALGDTLMPFPGVIFPYNNPLDVKWYWTTLGNNTVTVDEKSQLYSGNRFKFPRSLPDPVAIQLVFGPAKTVGIERAWSATIYPGVTQDRALFLTPQYLADLFGTFSGTERKYDMAWHFRGGMQASLSMESMQFSGTDVNGYNGLTNTTHASTSDAWSASGTTRNSQPVRFYASGGTNTEVIFGDGHFFTKKWTDDENPPTLIGRRTGNSTVYGSAVDISGASDSFVKSVAQEGSLDAGYALLKVRTAQGTDLCFTSYRPGDYTAGDLHTDAMQAFVRMDGKAIETLYLAGGKTLKTSTGSISRSEPGLASIEKTAEGSYIVSNPSSTAATVTVSVPALSGLKAYALDEHGKRGASVTVKQGKAGIALKLKPSASVEFVAKKSGK